MHVDESFSWTSPLGASVALLLVYGAIHVLFGAIYLLVAETDIGNGTLFASPGLDPALFGALPADLLRDDRVLAPLRSLLHLGIAGLLVSLGIVQLALTWFGLHRGQGWALVALAVSGLVMFPFWVLVLRTYLGAGGGRCGVGRRVERDGRPAPQPDPEAHARPEEADVHDGAAQAVGSLGTLLQRDALRTQGDRDDLAGPRAADGLRRADLLTLHREPAGRGIDDP